LAQLFLNNASPSCANRLVGTEKRNKRESVVKKTDRWRILDRRILIRVWCGKNLFSGAKVRQEADIVPTILIFFLSVLFVFQGFVKDDLLFCHKNVNEFFLVIFHKKYRMVERVFRTFAPCLKNSNNAGALVDGNFF
jgi:hypothetical protein